MPGWLSVWAVRGDLAAFGLKIDGGIGGKDGQARLLGADDHMRAILHRF
jgi:hypothetical protein